MIKNIAIVSLSSGTIGEDFVKHEVDIGIKRLNDFGLNVRFMPHALEGIEYVKHHPEKRAADLLQALSDPEIDMILCAFGGDDTYRLLPFLFEHNHLADAKFICSYKNGVEFLWKQGRKSLCFLHVSGKIE